MGKVEEKYADFYKRVGVNVGKCRRLKNLKQEELANLVGISYSYVTQIEAPNVVKKMSLEVLLDIANTLDVDILDLIA